MARTCAPAATADLVILQNLAKQKHSDRGFLWEVRKAGRSFHLLGTVHVARLEWDFPGPMTQAALEAATALAVEVDMTDPLLPQRMRDSVTFPQVERSPQDLIDRIRTQFELACLSPSVFAGASLSSQVTSLTLLSARDRGLYPDYAIDAAVIGYARVRGKKVVELEEASQQANALEGDLDSLRLELERLESGASKQLLLRLTSAWASSNLAEIESYFSWCNCYVSDRDRIAVDRLLKQRNSGLAAKIIRFHEDSPGGFVAVGILHMVGPNNVLDELSRAGYEARLIVPKSR